MSRQATASKHEAYFEDFAVGDVFEHPRGRTITDFDNYSVTHMTLNTAQAHFDREYAQKMLDGRFPERIVVGPCTIAIVVGLTSEDMSERAWLDLGMDKLRLPAPVFAGDTLRARSEVLTLGDSPRDPARGVMRYRFTGTNQRGETVVEGERLIELPRRASAPAAGGQA